MKTSNKRKPIGLSGEGSDDQCCCGEASGDNREEVIEAAKKHLCYATNIESSPDEMQCLDSFLFRCWQMGWLREYDNEKPAYEKVRKVYKAVCDALGKKGVKKAKSISES